MAHGGARRNAGRPKGSVNTRSQEIVAKAVAEGLTPLEYMLSIMRDTAQDEAVRIDCAKAAAPYIHPRLSNVEAKVNGHMSYEERLKALAGG